MSASSDDFSQKIAHYSEQTQERFEILRVWSNNQNRLNITILNYGQTDLEISAIYLNGTAVQHFISGKDATIGTSQLLTVDFTSPFTLQSSSCLQILAVSQQGGKATALYQT